LKREALGVAAVGLIASLLLSFGLMAMLDPDARLVHMAAAGTFFAALFLLAGRWLSAHLPHPRLGRANRLTALRAVLVANLGGFLILPAVTDAMAAWTIVALALAAFALDGCDGWLARREGLASPFGARIDQELDGVTILLLAALIWQAGVAGPWVMIAGLWRYAFLALRALSPAWRGDLPDSRRRRWICGLVVGGLVASLVPFLAGPPAQAIALASVVLLSISFAIDLTCLRKASDRRQGG
jgi:phosphatidylglycerophosphate synthase